MRPAPADRRLVAEVGSEQKNLAPLFAAVKADDAGAPDGVGDAARTCRLDGTGRRPGAQAGVPTAKSAARSAST
jgi:hypothetical protein